jgi:hypothetical protein
MPTIDTRPLAVALVLAVPTAALAQEDCGERIETVAERLPDLSEVPPEEAQARTGLDAEQLDAVTATLDAARLARRAEDAEGCMGLVEVVEDMLARADEAGAD